MSCNRCAATAEAVAPSVGAGSIEANWADNRAHPQQCKQCGAFLRGDSGCTRCENTLVSQAKQNPEQYENGYAANRYPEPVMVELAPEMSHSEDPGVRQVAATQLVDPERLTELGTNDESLAVKAAVAANTNTPPATLAGLLTSQKRDIYRAAATNQTLPVSALEQQAVAAQRQWEQLARKAIQPVIYQMAFSGGRGKKGLMGTILLPSIMFGMYGRDGFQSWRRHRDLSVALKKRRQQDKNNEASEAEQMAAPASPTLPSLGPEPPKSVSSRLTPKEWQAVDEELKLAESALELTDDYYEDQFTIDDVVRMQNDGIATDHDADVAGYLLEQAEETAERFPGWHDGYTPDDFREIQAKLRCPRCGMYAGGQHQCNYSSRLTALRHPEEPVVEAEGLSPVEVYAEVENG